jgi:predicted RNA-binding protein YlxR (DUF448 family)
MRFEAVDGVVREAVTPTGRGVYTCRDAECWDHAVEGRGFARSLRRPVAVEPELARLYTGVSHG